MVREVFAIVRRVFDFWQNCSVMVRLFVHKDFISVDVLDYFTPIL